eukprot:15347989-Ditylum_brightwellii.AAC.1
MALRLLCVDLHGIVCVWVDSKGRSGSTGAKMVYITISKEKTRTGRVPYSMGCIDGWYCWSILHLH